MEGISWADPWFMVSNYTALLTAYAGMFVYEKKISDRKLREAGRKYLIKEKTGRAGKNNLPDRSG